MLVRRRFLAILLQTSDNVSRPISRQDLRNFGPVTAFELLGLPGTVPFQRQRGSPDPPHCHGRTVGFELQFILFAIFIQRRTGDAGNSRGESSELLACSTRKFNERHRQAIDLRPVLGVQQHPVDLQFVFILFPPAIFTGKRNDMTTVGWIVERNHKICAALFGLEEGNGPALKIASCDFKRTALP